MTKKKGLKPEKPNSEIQFKFWLSHFLGVNLDSYPTFWSLHFPLCTVRTSLCSVKRNACRVHHKWVAVLSRWSRLQCRELRNPQEPKPIIGINYDLRYRSKYQLAH